MDNLEIAATADQSHMDHIMATIFQLGNTNKILVDQLKKLAKTNPFLYRQVQEDKSQGTIMIVILHNWIQPDIVGLVGGWSPRGISFDHEKQIRN